MKWRAFTLIELLVVIGIITILIAIVIPVMRVSKQYALTTKCSSNIKQLTLNLVSYDIKNEAFPYSLFFSNIGSLPEKDYADPSKDMIGWRWINYIFDDSAIELNQKSVLWCPSRRMGDDFYKLKNNMLIANYGVNQSVCKSWLPKSDEFEGSPLSSTNIRSPSQTLLIVDSGYST
jgi:prepilin-type N-terminal cleavage/methylation domain-containing protein